MVQDSSDDTDGREYQQKHSARHDPTHHRDVNNVRHRFRVRCDSNQNERYHLHDTQRVSDKVVTVIIVN